MADISAELLEKLQKSFDNNLASDAKAAALLEKIESGKGNYATAGDYAERVGASLAESFQTNLSSEALPEGTMYWNIAEKTIEPLFEEEYNLTSSAAAAVQKSLNTKAGMGLNAVKASYDSEAVKGIMDKVCSYASYNDAAWVLRDDSVSFARSVVDQTLKANIDFQGKSGRSPKIVRTASFNCCQWCADLEGIYEYPNVPEDVYRRHDNCRCDVEYDPGNGQTQNVHTKEWRDTEERAKIEERKDYGLKNSDNETRTIKELTESATQIKGEMQNYSDNPSKWSGVINIDDSLIEDNILGKKEWNCDIALISTADDGVIWHEMLHSGSASYYDKAVYSLNRKIEEGSVEYLTQQICKEKGIEHIEGCYKNQTTVLQLLNDKFQYSTDLEFAETLYNTPLTERYEWLENKVDSSLRECGASLEDYNDVMLFIEKYLKGE